MCSAHFTNGKRRDQTDVPTYFPWSKSRKHPAVRPCTEVVRERANTHLKSLRLAIRHDHSYCSDTYSPNFLRMPTDDKISTPTELIELVVPSIVLSASPNISRPIIQHDNQLVHFYTAFDDFDTLNVCFKFLGPSVNSLNY